MGRVRGRDLCVGLLDLLVHGDDSRFGDLSRSLEIEAAADDLRDPFPGMVRIIASLDALREGVQHSVGLGHAAGSVGTHSR